MNEERIKLILHNMGNRLKELERTVMVLAEALEGGSPQDTVLPVTPPQEDC